ncbi:hypothetical protein [Kurthia sibirica]|uniref:Uncharacterized protein n=1 Tax=Kurthia sibirica TaxID=202750 RepID=A0A2U3AKE6_9BACL|nr:hypothetical protein [Kurthia sibirica]PWI25007.1 hypothetical protein DEX24_10560 [Kurthia sibirica]GEK33087.1 hypothetical protein KSI01_06200 [Kurthia sibirica]
MNKIDKMNTKSKAAKISLIARMKDTKVKEDKKEKVWTRKIRFYALQFLKAIGILFLASLPLNIVDGMITNLALTLTDKTNVSYFADSARLNYMTTVASGIFLLGIYAIFFKLNWSFAKKQSKTKENGM